VGELLNQSRLTFYKGKSTSPYWTETGYIALYDNLNLFQFSGGIVTQGNLSVSGNLSIDGNANFSGNISLVNDKTTLNIGP
jgi:hypothetical protein